MTQHRQQQTSSSVDPETLAPRLVDTNGATQILGGISARHLWQLADDGVIPRVRLGRRVLFDVRDLNAAISAAKHAAYAPARGRSSR
ncbi:MAG: hypothetical protein JNM80_10495 [Phycisphaerae bacterium]|nr:hypothetical protein [Phycisphaerae bacterium]